MPDLIGLSLAGDVEAADAVYNMQCTVDFSTVVGQTMTKRSEVRSGSVMKSDRTEGFACSCFSLFFLVLLGRSKASAHSKGSMLAM